MPPNPLQEPFCKKVLGTPKIFKKHKGLLKKSLQTVDKPRCVRLVGEETHKNTFLKSFLRILKVLFLEKAP